MFPLFRLLTLAVRGLKSVSTSTSDNTSISDNTLTHLDPTNDIYDVYFDQYTKAFFDEDYQFLCYKFPLGNMPNDIVYYDSQIEHMTLMKKQSTTRFEIYETNVIGEKELAMNVEISYADFEMTGINSRKNTVVKQNQFFVLFINDKLERFEVHSSLQEGLSDKMIKNDFGEYLIKYLIKNKALQQDQEAVDS